MSRYGISGKEKKRIAPMWGTTNALYHYNDRERAEYLEGEEPRLVWVCIPNDFFISTWQFRDEFEGFIFDTEEEAEKVANIHNQSISN